MVKDGCLYLSNAKENQRSDNSYAILVDVSYVKIIEFIVDRESKKEFIIYQKLRTRPAFQGRCKMIQKITSITGQETAIPTSSLSKVCVHMNIQSQQYIYALPNLCSY